MQTLFLILIGYLLGSIPFGYIMGKIFHVDITKFGSGNIGATNVSRILGAWAGIAVFILDLLKGTFAVSLAINYIGEPFFIVFAGLSSIIGHMFPVFLKFKGGKGAAVGLGVLLGITPDIFFFTFLIVILVILISRYVSLASIVGSISAAVLMLLLQKPAPYTLAAFLGTIFIIMKHQENIFRLMQGTERKIGEKF